MKKNKILDDSASVLADAMNNSALKSNELTTSLDELNDEVITLAVQVNDTNKQARDLEDAFDIATDSTLDLAKAETTLTKTINSKNNSIGQSIEISDTLAYAQKETTNLEQEYQNHLKRRNELANKLNSQQELIRYSESSDKIKKFDNTEEPVSNKPKKAKEPKPESLDDYLDERGLSDLKQFKSELDSIKKKQKEQQGLFRKITTSAVVGGFGLSTDAVKTSMSYSGRMLENAMGLQQIPLYNESKQLTKFALNKTNKALGSIVSGSKEKLIERKFSAEREKATKEYHSNKESMTNSTNGETIVNNQQTEKQAVEEKKERDENKTERANNEKRHKGVINALENLGKSILLSSLSRMGIGLLASIATGIVSMVTGLGGVITSIAALGATIVAGFKTAMTGLLSKMFPSLVPDIDKTPKTKTPDVKKPDPNASKPKADTKTNIPNETKPKTFETGKVPETPTTKGAKPTITDKIKDAGMKSKTAITEGGEGLIRKVGQKGIGSLAMRGIGVASGVGTVMLAAEVGYHLLDYATDGKFSKDVNNMVDQMSPENKPLDKIRAIQSGKLSDSERASMSKEEADAIDKQRAEQREKLMQDYNRGFMSNVNTNVNKTTNVYSTGFFGMQSNNNNQMPAYGITPNY